MGGWGGGRLGLGGRGGGDGTVMNHVFVVYDQRGGVGNEGCGPQECWRCMQFAHNTATVFGRHDGAVGMLGTPEKRKKAKNLTNLTEKEEDKVRRFDAAKLSLPLVSYHLKRNCHPLSPSSSMSLTLEAIENSITNHFKSCLPSPLFLLVGRRVWQHQISQHWF